MIEINKQALEQTKEVCHQELEQITSKYNTSLFQTVIQCMKREIKQLMTLSILAMILIFITSLNDIDKSLNIFIIYYAILGLFAIFEYMKSDCYQTKDLLMVGYLNEGRSFLYLSCLFTIFEIMSFIIICIVLPLSYYDFIMTVLCAIVPILVSQIISIYFIQYIHSLLGSIVIYMISYAGVSFSFLVGEFYQFVAIEVACSLVIGLILFYILTITIVFKQRRERKEIWNWY